jgi:hypothetical protein
MYRRHLQPGDIIMFQRAGLSAPLIGQFISSRWLGSLNWRIGHCGIICSDQDLPVAHAVLPGCIRQPYLWDDPPAKLPGDQLFIYRLRRPGDHCCAVEAAQYATAWTVQRQAGSDYAVIVRYTKAACVTTGFASTSFGPKAAAAVEAFITQPISNFAMFCSMFIIACYQAAMGLDEARVRLPLHAVRTSPMYLDTVLQSDPGTWDRHLLLDAL